MGTKHIERISLLISLLVVISLSSATAGNIALTKNEINVLEPDTIGLLNGGVRVVEIIKNNYDGDTAIIQTDVSFFNTEDTDVTLDIAVEQFWEEREHTIKKNYTFYFMPNLNWVTTPDSITIQPMSKYIMPVTIEMPIKEGFEKSRGGGFICMISASRVGYEESHAHKLFLVLKEKPDDKTSGFNLLNIDPIYLLSLGAVGGIAVVAVVLKKRKEQYSDDYGEYDDEYQEEPEY